MSRSLLDMQTLRTVLGRLNAEFPASSSGRSGFTAYQARSGDFLERLRLELESRQGKARVLVTGQIGVGKSSEIKHYIRHRSAGSPCYLVYCDLEKAENPEHCGATGVFLTIMRDCWSAARYFERGLRARDKIRDEILEDLTDWLKGERNESDDTITFRFGGMEFPVELRDTDAVVGLILGKAAQHEAVSQPPDRFGLVPDRLVYMLNRLLDWMSRHWGNSNAQPVLFVDHVDKIRDSEAAEEVLVQSISHWERIRASVVMTAPFEFTLGELRHSVESKWGRPLMVYPLAIPELESGRIPEIYLRIVKSAGLADLTREEALRTLAHYSGGIPRKFVQFLVEAAKEAHFRGSPGIRLSDARVVVQNHERAYQDYTGAELELLARIARSSTGLGSAATLLRSPIGLLVLPPQEGRQGFAVHPLAEAALERSALTANRSTV